MNRIAYRDRRKTYLNAMIRFGDAAQSIVAIEELSECQKEICKFLRGDGNREHLAEEVADATIMLEQIRDIYQINDRVCDYMDQKIQRLDRRLRGGDDDA